MRSKCNKGSIPLDRFLSGVFFDLEGMPGTLENGCIIKRTQKPNMFVDLRPMRATLFTNITTAHIFKHNQLLRKMRKRQIHKKCHKLFYLQKKNQGGNHRKSICFILFVEKNLNGFAYFKLTSLSCLLCCNDY